MSLSLLEFCDRNGVTIADLARLGDLDKATLYKIARGERGFSPETAEKIQKVTGGAVTPTALVKVRRDWQRSQQRKPQKKSVRAEAAA